MAICKLCHENPADKKGSHLVPHFLMKKIDNADGKPGRDLELGFQLSGGFVEGYFGRSVQPEKLDKVYGERTDEENKEQRSNLIVDDMLCTACEKRLADVESEYSVTLQKYGDSNYQSTADSFNATLFWVSIFWRMSASDSVGFKLDEVDEHHLRIILDGGMKAADKKEYVTRLAKEITGITYKVLRCKDFTKDQNGFLYFADAQANPYCALIGDFAVFMSVDKPIEMDNGKTFLTLEKYIGGASTNSCEEGEWILPIAEKEFKNATQEVVNFWVRDFTDHLSSLLDRLHQKFIGKGEMDAGIKKEILSKLTESMDPLARKYTPMAITKAATDILIKYPLYRSIGEQ